MSHFTNVFFKGPYTASGTLVIDGISFSVTGTGTLTGFISHNEDGSVTGTWTSNETFTASNPIAGTFTESETDFGVVTGTVLGGTNSISFTSSSPDSQSSGTATIDAAGTTITLSLTIRIAGTTGSLSGGGVLKASTPIFLGGEGPDIIAGTDGSDVIDGRGGDDQLSGGAGNDKILGGAGNDLLDGGEGDDRLSGGTGNDTLVGATGDNLLDGGDGTDTAQLAGSLADYRVTVLDGPNTAKLFFTLSGLEPGDVVNLVSKDGRIDRMAGVEKVNFLGSGQELSVTRAELLKDAPVYLGTKYFADKLNTGLLSGTAGDDVLDGLEGNDTLNGLGGNDVLDGGAGDDTMAGGTGNDTYIVDSAADVVTELAGQGIDTVKTAHAAMTLADKANVDRLEYTGSEAFSGIGNALANTLTGRGGNDTLDGGLGADRLVGGLGDDTYVIDNPLDVVVEKPGEGTDTIQTARAALSLAALHPVTLAPLYANVENLTYTGGENFTGTGNAAANAITGGAGNDTLNGRAGADRLEGGAGDDAYVVDSVLDVVVEGAGQGTDVIRTALAALNLDAQNEALQALYANVENLAYTGAGSFAGTGSAEANLLRGGPGNDTLDGGAGDDTMAGGAGNDTYLVDSAGDVVTELAGQGSDAVKTALASMTLADKANVERLQYTGTENFSGTGNGIANTILGGAGNDSLDGGAGADRLIGGLGDDTYAVDNALDLAVEALDEGTDTVNASVSYTLGVNLENLVLAGAANLRGTGNGLSNTLTGNAGNNVLSGGAGDDTFFASGGNDTFVGGPGEDTLNLASLAFSFAEKGTPGGFSVARPDTLTVWITDLDTNQRLTVKGAWGAATGDQGMESYVFSDQTVTLAQLIADTASAFADNYAGTAEADSFDGLAGNDSIAGGAGADSLAGGLGNDTLDGGAGDDTLAGGAGNDTYVVDSADDVVTELLGQGSDLVRTALASYTLGEHLERLEYTGTDAFSGTGNGLANTLVGGAGNDTLDGGTGADRMQGGAGDDSYTVDNALDVVVEKQNEGTDTIETARASLSLAALHPVTLAPLFANVENLTYTGAGSFTGTGNALNNQIAGGGGNDTLSGGAGDDTLEGGAGNDRLLGGTGTDTAVFSGLNSQYTVAKTSTGYRVVGPDGEDALIGVESARFDDGPFALADLAALNPEPLLESSRAPQYAVNALLYPAADGARWNAGSALGTAISVTYSFMATIPSYSLGGEHPGFQPLTAAQQSAVRAVLAEYSHVAKVNFIDVSDSGAGGQLRFGRDQQSDSVGYAYAPSLFDPQGGDVWLDVDDPSNLLLAPGEDGLHTIIHEIGHALGLKHPGNYSGHEDSPFLPAAEDNQAYTAMAYDEAAGAMPETLMLYDIAALQALYGVNRAWHAGDDVYALPFDRAFRQTLWDGAGNDTLDFAAFVQSLRVDLQPGAFSTIGMISGQNKLAIAFGTVIENAIGGSADDTLVGNAAANVLAGGGGNDVLTGGAGADTFDFSAILDAATNVDTITDFFPGTDRILLDLEVFSGFGAAGPLAAEAFAMGGGVAQGQEGDDRIVYDTSSGALYFDPDGIGGAAAVQFALLGTASHPALAYSDFDLV